MPGKRGKAASKFELEMKTNGAIAALRLPVVGMDEFTHAQYGWRT